MSLSLICLLASAVVVFGFRVTLQYLTTRDSGLRISHRKSSKTEMRVVYTQVFAILGMLLMTVLESLGVIKAHLDLGLPGDAIGIALLIFGLIGGGQRATTNGTSSGGSVSMSLRRQNSSHMGCLSTPAIQSMRGCSYLHLQCWCCYLTLLCAFSLQLDYGGVEMQVRLVEEPYLRNVHGSAYDSYCQQVNRYFPTPRIT